MVRLPGGLGETWSVPPGRAGRPETFCQTLLAIVCSIAVFVVATGVALGASGAEPFRTPSGNIYCAYEHYSFAPIDLRCEIRSGVKPLPPKPRTCEFDWGAGYAMRQTGRPHILCISDTIHDFKARVLGYGTTWRGGAFTCTSKTTGLRCSNRSGHGFFLSRERSYSF
jgi:hypothetical protein